MSVVQATTHAERSLGRVLADIAHTLEAGEAADARVRDCLARLREIVPYDRCALLDSATGAAQAVTVLPSAEPAERAALMAQLRGLLALVVEDRAAPLSNDPPSPWVAHLAVPLVSLDRVVGLLWVARSSGEYEEDHLSVLAVVAAQLAGFLAARRAQHALRGHEERIAFALRASGVGTWEIDLATGEMQCSAECRANFGIRQGEEFSRYEHVLARIHPEDIPAQTAAAAEALHRGDEYAAEYRVLLPEGGVRWILARGRPHDRSNGTPTWMSGITLDVTARKEAEAALQVSEERFRLATRAVQGLVYDWDLATGHVVRGNGIRELLGFEPDEAEPTNAWWLARIHPDDLDAARQQEAPAQDAFSVEYRVRHRDGHYVHLRDSGLVLRDADGRATRIVGNSLSIDREVAAEAALRSLMEAERQQRLAAEQSARQLEEAHALLDTIFASAPVGLAFFDADLRYVRVNRALAEMNGLPVEAHLGRTPPELLPGLAGIDEIMAAWRGVMATGRPLLGVEVVGETPAELGRQRTWQETFYPVRIGTETIGLGVVAEDVTDRKATEAALRASEERFRLAAEAINGLVYDWDLASGTLYRSDGLLDVLGFAPNEVAATAEWWTERMHPDDLASLRAQWDEMARGRAPGFAGEYRIRHRDGRWIWVREHGRVIWGEQGQPVRIVGSTWSVDAERRAADALRTSEQRLRLALAAGRMGVWSWDRRSDEQEWDEMQRRLLGLQPGERPSRTLFFERLHLDDRARLATLRTPYELEPGTDGNAYEFRVVLPSGEVRWLASRQATMRDADGRALADVGVNWDITEQRLAQERLRASEARLSLVVEAAHDGIWDWDLTTGEAVWSDRVYEMLGLERAAVHAGIDLVTDLIHPDDRAPFVAAVRAHLEASVPYRVELRMRRADGSYGWFLGTGKALRDADGRPIRIAGSLTDITARKQAEAERERLLAALGEANRIKDDLMATVAHDLRNPLAAISGQAQLVERYVTGPDGVERALKSAASIVRQALTMQRLVEQLVEVTRAELGQEIALVRGPVDLGELIERLVDQYGTLAREHELRVERPPDGVLIGQWDADRLEQVVANLLSNALKYSPSGGAVRVTAGREDRDGRPGALLRVSDQGLGIPVADLPRVFERFHRGGNVRDTIHGLGIGLAGTRQIVTRHGGTIAVESVEGQGSTFTVWLPLAAEAPAPNAE